MACDILSDPILGDDIINIRESILINRIKYEMNQEKNTLQWSLSYLERYFSLIAFASYLHSRALNVHYKFSDWVRDRSEIWSMLKGFREKGNKLPYFRPLEHLSPEPSQSNIVHSDSMVVKVSQRK